jgi:hypothetical protein
MASVSCEENERKRIRKKESEVIKERTSRWVPPRRTQSGIDRGHDHPVNSPFGNIDVAIS